MEVIATTPTRSWYSFYIYPEVNIDGWLGSTLAETVRIFSEKVSAKEFFFIRYADEYGVHVRLRLKAASKTDIRIRGYTRWLVPNVQRLRHVRYKPELRRYGGRAMIGISERHFINSSKWISMQSQVLLAPYQKRLVCAAICASVCLLAAFPNTLARRRFAISAARGGAKRLASDTVEGMEKILQEFEKMIAAYQTHWNRIWEIASHASRDDASQSNSAFRQWAQICGQDLGQLDSRFAKTSTRSDLRNRIISSWIHMHNNRLGIHSKDEVLIILSVARA